MPSPFTHNQAFSQAILSTTIFSQGFNFFTVFLIHSHCEVPPWCVSKVKFLKFRSPDCWKHHFWHFSVFSRQYYSLVINAHKIASHRLVPMTQNIKGMENTCALAINMIETIIKDLHQTPKTGLKIIWFVITCQNVNWRMKFIYLDTIFF